LPVRGRGVASQPTLSRLENAIDRHTTERLAAVLVALYPCERGRSGPSARVVLDVDGTADLAHGTQEGVRYHSFYRQYRYHPLLVIDGETCQLITAVLSPGHCHARCFVVLVLRRLLRHI
jgi:hypothetical protein